MNQSNASRSVNSKAEHEYDFTSSNPIRLLKNGSRQNFLFGILYWTGLLVDSGRREIIVYVFFIIVAVISSDGLVMIFFTVQLGDMFTRIALLYLVSVTLTSLSWHVLKHKKKTLSKLLSALNATDRFTVTKVQIFTLFFIFGMPIALAVLDALQPKPGSGFIYGYKLNSTVGIIFEFIKSFLRFFIHPTWANFVLFLYCIFCQNIVGLLHILTREIQSYSPQKFTMKRQLDILRCQSKIVDVIYLIQAVFSVPTFLISVAHFTHCIAVLGMIVVIIFPFRLHSTMSVEWILMLVNSSGGLLACLWMAGKLPMEAEKLKEAFCKKTRQRLLLVGKVDKICVEKQLAKSSSFVLSGCDIVFFRKSSILALAGTVLTYTVLLVTKA